MSKDKYSSGDGYMYVYLLSIVACVVVALVVALMVFGSGLFKKNNESNPVIGDTSETSSTVSEDNTSYSDSDVSESSRFTQGSVDNAVVNTGLLLLVDSNHKYVFPEEDDRVNLFAALKGSNISFSGSGITMNTTAAKALKAMCEAFYTEAGMDSGVLVYNAYRSYDKVAETDGADAAGTSDFHTGNSVTLMSWPASLGEIGEGRFAWFTENCYSYGFIQRFPADKESVTGYPPNGTINRGVVYRYVGVCHAYYMYKNNLCLEEYLELLKQYTHENPLIIDVQNKSYEVYYQPMEDGLTSSINIPIESAYLISGNNSDGFIVTITG